jgi:hypothetical protein
VSVAARSWYFEDVEVGREWESPTRTLTPEETAGLAGPPGAAARLPGPGTLGPYPPPLRALAILAVRPRQTRGAFQTGETVRVRSRAVEKDTEVVGGLGVIAWQYQVVRPDGQVVHDAVALTLVEARGGDRRLPVPAGRGWGKGVLAWLVSAAGWVLRAARPGPVGALPADVFPRDSAKPIGESAPEE